MYYLYLLRCADNSLYCGQTKDIKRRIEEHNSDNSKSKYTRIRRPVKLVYIEEYRTLSRALKREFEIKKMTKSKKESLIKKASYYLNNILKKNLNKKILFLVSGGSAFKLLEEIDKKNIDSNLTISVLDERFSIDPKINNYLQLSSTSFYKNAKKKKCQFIETIPQLGESLSKMAVRFERDIRRWKSDNPKGLIIITQGIGLDGHTAGIMPYPEDLSVFKNLFESKSWVVGYNAINKNKFPERVTTTVTFLKKFIDHSIVYTVGKDKKSIVDRIKNNNIDLASLPAGVIKQMKDAQIFIE